MLPVLLAHARKTAPRDHWSWSPLLRLLWRCPCFRNVTSVGGACQEQVEQSPWSRGISLAQEKPSSPLSKGFGGCFLAVSLPCFFCHYFTRWFLRIWRPVPWKSGRRIQDIGEGRETLEAACSDMLDSSKCLKPRISHTQRPHLLWKLEKWMPSDANRSMFSSPGLLSSFLPK